MIVMIRHASIIDNALPDAILGHAHGLGFRFIIKRELQMLPTIDIGGRWVPTLFVRRASGDTEGELERMRSLTVEHVRARRHADLPRGHPLDAREARAREGDHRRAPARASRRWPTACRTCCRHASAARCAARIGAATRTW